MAAMSRSHFSHTFHAVAAWPCATTSEISAQHAHQLMLTSPLSLTAVAIDSGFYDLPHFDKAFRQRIGVSPQEYRHRYGPEGDSRTTGSGNRAARRLNP